MQFNIDQPLKTLKEWISGLFLDVLPDGSTKVAKLDVFQYIGGKGNMHEIYFHLSTYHPKMGFRGKWWKLFNRDIPRSAIKCGYTISLNGFTSCNRNSRKFGCVHIRSSCTKKQTYCCNCDLREESESNSKTKCARKGRLHLPKKRYMP